MTCVLQLQNASESRATLRSAYLYACFRMSALMLAAVFISAAVVHAIDSAVQKLLESHQEKHAFGMT